MGELDVRTNDCVSMKFMLEVFETKYTDHVEKKIKGLPEQDDIVLKAAVNLFSDVGEEKRVSYKQLFDETESECKIAYRENISRNAFYHVMTELEFYSLIKLFPKKQNQMHGLLSLNVELRELDIELQKKET